MHRKIIADGLDRALVLEDDVITSGDLVSLADALRAHLVGAEVALLNFDREQVCKLSRREAVTLPGSRQLLVPVDVASPQLPLPM